VPRQLAEQHDSSSQDAEARHFLVTSAIAKMDEPRTLSDRRERDRRLSLTSLAHVEPLTSYVHKLRECGFGEVPYFDPLDEGINAEALFLFEKPGPQAVGSGFISRNNDDPTAENTFRFMQQIFSGYENFVSRIDPAQHAHWPEWMAKIDFTGLKLKLMSSIVAISAIQLLRAFVNVKNLTIHELAWYVGIHLVFVVSGLLLALSDRLSEHRPTTAHEVKTAGSTQK
jgi:Uncharacterized protein family, UPF0114